MKDPPHLDSNLLPPTEGSNHATDRANEAGLMLYSFICGNQLRDSLTSRLRFFIISEIFHKLNPCPNRRPLNCDVMFILLSMLFTNPQNYYNDYKELLVQK